jgi:hypothetical protein
MALEWERQEPGPEFAAAPTVPFAAQAVASPP